MDYEKPLLEGETREDVEAGEPREKLVERVFCTRLRVITLLEDLILLACTLYTPVVIMVIPACVNLVMNRFVDSPKCPEPHNATTPT